jgi:hypothetical protein
MAEEYQVSMTYDNAVDVTLESAINTQVSTSYIVAESLEDLGNVDTSALDKTGSTTNNYVMVYDAVGQKYKFVNPDTVLSAAADTTQVVQPGLPQDFIDRLDVDLDNKIDLDGGSF